MKNFYFFNIPVYRITEDKYSKEFEKYLSQRVSTPEYIKDLELNPKIKSVHHAVYFKGYGGQWEFNEIIGWIKLYTLGDQIRGEYYQVDKKRIVRSRKKIFEYKTHKLAAEKTISLQDSNEKIYRTILDYLFYCKKENIVKNRYLDLEIFERVGAYIDWKKLFSDK